MGKAKRITKKHILKLCTTCMTGMCCREGVEVDLSEAKRIAKLNVDIKKPWFEGLFYDRALPSKWGVGTVVRGDRCVFQAEDYRCLIYKNRPRYCRDFPLEYGSIADLYHYLCELPSHTKRTITTHFQPRPRRLKINLKKL